MIRASVKFSLISLLVTACVSIELNKEAWDDHIHKVAQFKCSVPQQRSVDLNEILSKEDKLNTTRGKIYPEVTFLHRCEDAGCCSAQKKCMPDEQEYVSLVFGIVRPEKIPNIEFFEAKVSNHTHCSCQNKKDIPK